MVSLFHNQVFLLWYLTHVDEVVDYTVWAIQQLLYYASAFRPGIPGNEMKVDVTVPNVWTVARNHARGRYVMWYLHRCFTNQNPECHPYANVIEGNITCVFENHEVLHLYYR